MAVLSSIDLRLAVRLKDREFRQEWFRAQLESDVPELFRDMREERDLTQSDLAEAAGMKQSAISRFEGSRDAKWKFDTLLKLAEALDVQLVISLLRAEDVIRRYEREEEAGSLSQKSALDAAPQVRGLQAENSPGVLSAQQPRNAALYNAVTKDAIFAADVRGAASALRHPRKLQHLWN